MFVGCFWVSCVCWWPKPFDLAIFIHSLILTVYYDVFGSLLTNPLFLLCSGLHMVLKTGNMTSYPDTCSKVTASFSVLSETVKTIQTILLKERKRSNLSTFIRQLQSHEQEKLHLTAAHHLERVRQQQHNHQQPHDQVDPRIAHLLDEGVASLSQKIAVCIECINEVLDELRCEMMEEEEE
jgi:hypothetical protein